MRPGSAARNINENALSRRDQFISEDYHESGEPALRTFERGFAPNSYYGIKRARHTISVEREASMDSRCRHRVSSNCWAITSDGNGVAVSGLSIHHPNQQNRLLEIVSSCDTLFCLDFVSFRTLLLATAPAYRASYTKMRSEKVGRYPSKRCHQCCDSQRPEVAQL